jgi:hypothetical protein
MNMAAHTREKLTSNESNSTIKISLPIEIFDLYKRRIWPLPSRNSTYTRTQPH